MFLRFSPGAATTSDARHSPLEHLATFPDAGPREEGTARKKSFETGVLAAEARTDGHRTSFQARRNRQSRTLSYEINLRMRSGRLKNDNKTMVGDFRGAPQSLVAANRSAGRAPSCGAAAHCIGEWDASRLRSTSGHTQIDYRARRCPRSCSRPADRWNSGERQNWTVRHWRRTHAKRRSYSARPEVLDPITGDYFAEKARSAAEGTALALACFHGDPAPA